MTLKAKSENIGKKSNQTGTTKSSAPFSISQSQILNHLRISKPLTPITDLKKIQGDDWIKLGKNDLYFEELAEAVRLSPTANAVVTSKAKYFVGNGLGGDERAVEFLESVCSDKGGINELCYRLFTDWIIFGNRYLKRVWDAEMESFKVYHKDSCFVRLGKPLSGYEVTHCRLHPYWKGVQKNEPDTVALYPNNTAIREGDEIKGFKQILWEKDYTPASHFYGFGNWLGAQHDCITEYLYSLYNLSEVENGMHIGGIFVIKKQYSADDENSGYDDEGRLMNPRQSTASQLQQNVVGTSEGNAGKVIFIEADGGNVRDSFDYIQIPTSKDSSWIQGQERIEGNIVKAFNWFPVLAGIERQGSLGDVNAIRDSKRLADEQADKERTRLINNMLRPLLPPELREAELFFEDAMLITDSESINLNEILSTDEKRELKGYEPSETKEQESALNGAQITSMVEVISSPVLNPATKASVLKIALNLTDEQVAELLNNLEL